MSYWQVLSAHLTTGAITSIADDNLLEVGPIYLPMTKGSGKTTGATWSLVDGAKEYPDLKICFLTPFKDSIDVVYKKLATLGDAALTEWRQLMSE